MQYQNITGFHSDMSFEAVANKTRTEKWKRGCSTTTSAFNYSAKWKESKRNIRPMRHY